MVLGSWVCFDVCFLRVRYGGRQNEPARLLDAAEFFDTRSSPVEDIQNSSFTFDSFRTSDEQTVTDLIF